MKENIITVLKVEPGKHPELCHLRNDLDALQKAVSIGCDSQGLIEIIELEDGICLLCNEEGKLLGLEGNRKIGNDITMERMLGCLPPSTITQKKLSEELSRRV